MTKPTAKYTVAVDDKIMDIYMEAQAYKLTPKQFNDQLKAELGKLFMDEIIGADEVVTIGIAKIIQRDVRLLRNELKAEIRQRITDTFGEVD